MQRCYILLSLSSLASQQLHGACRNRNLSSSHIVRHSPLICSKHTIQRTVLNVHTCTCRMVVSPNNTARTADSFMPGIDADISLTALEDPLQRPLE